MSLRWGLAGLAIALLAACAWLPGDVAAFKAAQVKAFDALPARAGFDVVELLERADTDLDRQIVRCAARTYRVSSSAVFPPVSEWQANWRRVADVDLRLPECATAAMRAHLAKAQSNPSALVFVLEGHAGGETATSQYDRVNLYSYMLLDRATGTLYTSFLMVDPTV
jgi:hypothetical protein